ncbi:unnamed protein product [Didymodactylos carnosus]|uniref:Uncharacterized protein n=1 Tax=Didymodactylos carnosus TaxID=1234261 RepID=A0A814YTX1_9BILA|nr:unnamed protein product [Didymodactylos carnosus]CAF1234630.1 unnamed protein product [Didymodactylos carnosus]CAF3859407.1 unnamed protein product [Didymodactylos carnosus]CAF3997130.1 unnamed protein product [Didymodactylos carnosus]
MLFALIVVSSIAVAYIDAGSNKKDESRLPKHGCLNECYRHVGVYYLSYINSTTHEIITFHADGTFSAVDSDEDGNQYSTDPADTPYSSEYGIWKCDGKNDIEATSLDFSFPTLAQPCYRSLDVNTYSFKFDHDQVEGKITYTAYKENSLSPNQPSVPINGPIAFPFQGYKVFSLCEEKQHKEY